MEKYKLLEHTADIMIEVEGDTVKDLIQKKESKKHL